MGRFWKNTLALAVTVMALCAAPHPAGAEEAESSTITEISSQPIATEQVQPSGPVASLEKGTTKIGVISMDVNAHPQEKDTLERALEFVDIAAAQGCNLIVLPECCIYGFGGRSTAEDYIDQNYLDTSSEYAVKMFSNAEYFPDGYVCSRFIHKAKVKNVYIVYNGIGRDHENPRYFYNTSVLVGPEGFIGSYNKVHLAAGEQSIMANGEGFKVFETKLGKIGMMISYDAAFPESARIMALMGAEIIVVNGSWPSAQPASGKEEDDEQLSFFDALTKCYAVTNGVYIAVANAANPGSLGHSTIVSPDGRILARTAGYGEGVASAYIGNAFERGNMIKFRMTGGLNFMKDRRPDCYRELSRFQPGCFFNNREFREAINYFTGQR